MVGPFSFLKRLMTAIADGILMPNRKYMLQFGNDDVPFKWLQANIAMSDNQRNTPGINVAAHSAAAVRTPEITRVAIGDNFDSAMQCETPNVK